MWTREHRTIHRQSGERLPSDLTDAQWAHLEPLIPPADPGGRPRKTDMRAAMNAIFYLLRTGCPWRYLPRGPFPPRSTVYNIFRKFQREGAWEAIWAELLFALREQTGREASPTAAIIDSQSLKSAEKGAVKTGVKTIEPVPPASRIATARPWSSTKYASGSTGSSWSGPTAATTPGRSPTPSPPTPACASRSSSEATT